MPEELLKEQTEIESAVRVWAKLLGIQVEDNWPYVRSDSANIYLDSNGKGTFPAVNDCTIRRYHFRFSNSWQEAYEALETYRT